MIEFLQTKRNEVAKQIELIIVLDPAHPRWGEPAFELYKWNLQNEDIPPSVDTLEVLRSKLAYLDELIIKYRTF